MFMQNKMASECPCCKNHIVREICVVGEKVCDDQYHYNLEWLVQCDVCKTIYTAFAV
jgi:NAD-dependent SIR2 family protein deacetylase